MIVYSVPGCPLCRKVKAVLREKNIYFREKSLYASLLDEDEWNILLARIMAAEDFCGISMPEDPEYLRQNPSCIPRPLMFREAGEPGIDISFYERLCGDCKTYPVCAEVRQK